MTMRAADTVAVRSRTRAARTGRRPAASGLDELLKKGREEAQGAADDIDRILKLADHEHRGGT